MNTEKVLLSQVAINSSNPRTITEEKLEQLVESILVLPQMLELRPVVVDETMQALGGNMRLTALNRIATFGAEDIFNRLTADDDFKQKTDGEKQLHLEWWSNWLTQPFCYIVHADALTKSDKEQFIVKDNLSFGAWDWHRLTKQFTPMKLQAWGMDNVPNFTGLGAATQTEVDAQSESFVEDGVDTGFVNLPPELAGVELEAEEHEKIVGEDKTEYSRIIIAYKDCDIDKLCALLCLDKLDKVVYNLEELIP